MANCYLFGVVIKNQMKKEKLNSNSGRKEFGNYIFGTTLSIQAKLSARGPSAK